MLLASGMSSKERLWRFYERLTDDRIVAIAAGVTFYALLAIFPAIAALVAIYGLFADPAAIAKHLDDISNFIPAGAIEVIRDQLARVTSGGRGTLGFAFVIGLGISLWSANAGVKALIDALNIAYGEREKRGFIRLNGVSLAFTLGGILTVMVAIGVIVVLPLALHYVGLEGSPRSIVVLAKWPRGGAGHRHTLPLWPEPHRAPVALDHLGQRAGRDRLDHRIGSFLLVCGELRHLQQDLWVTRRSYRVHDVDVAFNHRHPARRGARCRDGAPDIRRQEPCARARAPRCSARWPWS